MPHHPSGCMREASITVHASGCIRRRIFLHIGVLMSERKSSDATCIATWCTATVSVLMLVAHTVMSVYTPMRLTLPSSSMELEFAKGLICSSRLGMMSRRGMWPRLRSRKENAASAVDCASRVAYAAPTSPRLRPLGSTAKRPGGGDRSR